jgi:hypothetical protein
MDISTALAQRGAIRVKSMTRTADAYQFNGGLNIMDSTSVVKPGELLGCLNYEPGVRGGYRRWDGYERMDGHPSPSLTSFMSVGVGVGFAPPVGATLTESGSGATGQVCYVDSINNVIVATNISGSFIGNGSTITASVGGATISTTPAFLDGATTTALTNQYSLAKYNYLQSFIGPVGGSSSSGPVIGVCPYAETVYAFRNNAAGTAADMWAATSSGWSKVALGLKVRFDTGVFNQSMTAPLEGTVLVGATSACSMTIKRINANSGTWGADAAGYFIVSSITGTPSAGELLQVGGVTYMTYRSFEYQVLPPDGTYRFRLYNFNAAQDPATGFRMYGVNGVGNGFEYDSTSDTFVLIETGMSPDTPQHLEVHASYLFYGFLGGSLQNSGYQYPLNWNPVFGASERSVGAEITFMREDVSQTLVIGTRLNVWTLTGISLELFQIKIYSSNTGAIARTDEQPGKMMFMEDRGFTTVAATAHFGEFESSSLSDKILTLVAELIQNDTPVGAVVTRYKNMYRLMFSSGEVLCAGVNAQGDLGGWTTGSVLVTPSCFNGGYTQAAGSVQVERCFMGATDGYVYEMDRGYSFDGQNLTHFLRLAYNSSRTPDLFKRYRKVQIDLQPEGYCSLSISVDFDYGNRSGQANQPLSFTGNGGFWDVALWDRFNWDGAQYAQASMKLDGEGYNIGLFFAGESNNDAPLTIYGASLQWAPRVINRNTGSQ